MTDSSQLCIVLFQLLFQSQNPGIEFEYTVPNENATEHRIPEFYWKYLPWTHCTVSCGGGMHATVIDVIL